jgi:hypothetical protein
MEKRYQAVSERNSLAQNPEQLRPVLWLRRNWDLLALILLVLASFPAEWFSPRTLAVSAGTNLIDDSWLLDTSFKAASGLWFGRDVVFTYGPVFQWLSSEPGAIDGPVYGRSLRDAYHATPVVYVLLWIPDH